MHATAILPAVRTIVLPDPRRRRGKHRAPRLCLLASRAAAGYVRLRFEVLTVAAAAGAVLWAAHGVSL